MKNLEDIKNQYIILTLFVGLLAYIAGQNIGQDQAKTTFLDSAYISSCDEKGEYCYIDTKDGEKEISCIENNRCTLTPKEPKTLKELEMDKKLDEIIKNSMPTKEEINRILNE